MPTFNSAAFLASTVASVQAQTFEGWELVLSDDGSTDQTLAVASDIAALDRRIRCVAGTNGGPAVARNRGFCQSDPRSEFVVFLDSDDTWEPDALALLLGALEAEPRRVAAYGLARATDLSGNQYLHDDLTTVMRRRRVVTGGHYVELPITGPTTFEAMVVNNCVVTPGTAMVRPSAVRALGGFDPTTSPGDDWDFFLRLSRLGGLVLVNEVILNWRRHPDSLANTSRQFRRSYYTIVTRAATAPEHTGAHRHAALAALVAQNRGLRGVLSDHVRHRKPRAALHTAKSLAYGYAAYADVRTRRLPGRRNRGNHRPAAITGGNVVVIDSHPSPSAPERERGGE